MSLDDESVRSIEMWILEHACKTRMEKVINKILKRRIDDHSFFLPNVDSISPLKSRNWIYLTVLIRSLDRELASLKKDLSCAPLCCKYDLKLSAKTVSHFEKMYSECHFLPLKMFTNVVTRLRLLEIIVKIIGKVDANKIMKDMLESFPKESSSFKTNLQQQFKIESLNMANQMMSVYMCCRNYIVKLMAMTADKKERYLNENLPNELAEFAITGRKYLKEACGYIAAQMPQSPLEQIRGGASEDLKYSDDHCVQILLQYLTDDITEESLLKVLKELDVGSEINLARISRRLSNIMCDDSFDGEKKTENTNNITNEKSNSALKDTAKRKKKKNIATEISGKKKVKVMLNSTPSLLADRYFSSNMVLKAVKKKKRVSRDSASDSPDKNNNVGIPNNISRLSPCPVVLPDKESFQDGTIPEAECPEKDTSLESPVENGHFFVPVKPCEIILRPKRTFIHEGKEYIVYS